MSVVNTPNPYMNLPLWKLIEREASRIRPELRDKFIDEAMNNQSLNKRYDMCATYYDNLFEELLFDKDFDESYEELNDLIDDMVNPENIQDYIETFMSISEIEKAMMDYEQWVKWELEVYRELADGLLVPLNDFDKVSELYPQVWKKKLEENYNRMLDEAGDAS